MRTGLLIFVSSGEHTVLPAVFGRQRMFSMLMFLLVVLLHQQNVEGRMLAFKLGSFLVVYLFTLREGEIERESPKHKAGSALSAQSWTRELISQSVGS